MVLNFSMTISVKRWSRHFSLILNYSLLWWTLFVNVLIYCAPRGAGRAGQLDTHAHTRTHRSEAHSPFQVRTTLLHGSAPRRGSISISWCHGKWTCLECLDFKYFILCRPTMFVNYVCLVWGLCGQRWAMFVDMICNWRFVLERSRKMVRANCEFVSALANWIIVCVVKGM